jgi:hypothetical protein
MKAYKEKTWQYETTGVEGNTTLFGVNIFDYEWTETGEMAHVKDNLNGKDFKLPIYTVVIDYKKYQFACGELSNNVYGFYLYKH